jgi:UDP-glucose 4-epimerase
MTGSRSEIKYGSERSGDVKHSLASIDKLLAAGFTPTGRFADGLKTTVDFFVKRHLARP